MSAKDAFWTWKQRRAELYMDACREVAERTNRGETLKQAMKAVTPRYHGRDVGQGRKMNCGLGTLRNAWFASNGGQNPDAFRFNGTIAYARALKARSQAVPTAWKQRRAEIYMDACREVAERVERGETLEQAVKDVAAHYNGLDLGQGRKMNCGRSTLKNAWYASSQGRNPDAFRFNGTIAYARALKARSQAVPTARPTSKASVGQVAAGDRLAVPIMTTDRRSRRPTDFSTLSTGNVDKQQVVHAAFSISC